MTNVRPRSENYSFRDRLDEAMPTEMRALNQRLAQT
jgi:hypothetical protein